MLCFTIEYRKKQVYNNRIENTKEAASYADDRASGEKA